MAPLETPQACSAMAPGEQLLIWSLQGWASARMAGDAPHRPLGAVLTAKTSARAAALFIAWIQAIEAASLRPIRAQCAHCGGASEDLQRLVAACGVAPVALREGERLIEPLVSEPRSIMILARSLNDALFQAGWPLPARLAPPVREAVDYPEQAPTMH